MAQEQPDPLEPPTQELKVIGKPRIEETNAPQYRVDLPLSRELTPAEQDATDRWLSPGRPSSIARSEIGLACDASLVVSGLALPGYLCWPGREFRLRAERVGPTWDVLFSGRDRWWRRCHGRRGGAARRGGAGRCWCLLATVATSRCNSAHGEDRSRAHEETVESLGDHRGSPVGRCTER